MLPRSPARSRSPDCDRPLGGLSHLEGHEQRLVVGRHVAAGVRVASRRPVKTGESPNRRLWVAIVETLHNVGGTLRAFARVQARYVPSILTHGVHGLPADDNDDAAVAAHVLALLERPDEARALARAARATCRTYEWPVVRAAWLDVYRELAGRHGDVPVQATT
jgi:glycosyltransferase involved in cell wall biosynthesis